MADLGCGLLPLLEEFAELGRACGVLRLEYCGLEKEAGVFEEACKVRERGMGVEREESSLMAYVSRRLHPASNVPPEASLG